MHDAVLDNARKMTPDETVNLLEASGMFLKPFCALHGLSPKTVRKWRSRRKAGKPLRLAPGLKPRITADLEPLFLDMIRSRPFPNPTQVALVWQAEHEPHLPPLRLKIIRDYFHAHHLEFQTLPKPPKPPKPPKEKTPRVRTRSEQKCRQVRFARECLPIYTPEECEERVNKAKETRYQPYHRSVPDKDEGQDYPSDLTHAQWALVAPLFERPFSRGRKPANARATLNAILYVLHTGTQWRFLPLSYPKWNSVARAFQRYRAAGLWEKLNEALVQTYEEEHPCQWAQVGIADSQSVETCEKGGSADMTAIKREMEGKDISWSTFMVSC